MQILLALALFLSAPQVSDYRDVHAPAPQGPIDADVKERKRRENFRYRQNVHAPAPQGPIDADIKERKRRENFR